MSKLGLMVVFATMVGCGGDSGGTGPISAADARAGCEAGCERDNMCDPTSTETVADCTASCVADIGGGGVRTDAFDAISACIADLACTASDDVCINECSPTSAHESYETKCRAKATECGAPSADVDGLCETTPDAENGFLCLFTPAVMNELAACFDLACTGIDGCFSTVSAKYGLN